MGYYVFLYILPSSLHTEWYTKIIFMPFLKKCWCFKFYLILNIYFSIFRQVWQFWLVDCSTCQMSSCLVQICSVSKKIQRHKRRISSSCQCWKIQHNIHSCHVLNPERHLLYERLMVSLLLLLHHQPHRLLRVHLHLGHQDGLGLLHFWGGRK